MKDRAIPAAPVKNDGDGNEEITNSGHRKARAQEAKNMRSSTRRQATADAKSDKKTDYSEIRSL